MTKVLSGSIIASLLFISLSSYAQQATPLTIQEALETALQNNKEVVLSTLAEEGAAARLKQTNAIFLPQIRVSYTAMSTNNPLNAFGFKLQQQSIAPTDFNPELLNNPSSTQNFMAKAEWQQPILNMDMLYKRKAAQQQTEVYGYQSRRTKEFLAHEVRRAYAQLQLAHQAQQVVEEAYKTVSAIYKATSDRFEKGFLQKSDVLTVQVHLMTTESQLSEVRSNVQNASDYLSLLMNKPSGVVYTVSNIQPLAEDEDIQKTIPDSRADFLAMQSAIEAQDAMVGSEKMTFVPRLNAFAEYMFNDQEALGFGSDAYLVGAQLSWTLFNGMATRHKINESKIERTRMEEQLSYQKAQSQLELSKTIRQLNDARISLRQKETAVTQAEEALRILQNRYSQGLVTTHDVLQAQTLLSQQQLSLAQAVFTLNTTYAYLRFLTTVSE